MKLSLSPSLRRLTLVSCALLAPLLLITAVLIASQSQASASSHREAPLISKDPYADNTDTYVFLSPENQNNVVLVGAWIPFEGPEGGPNYYEWDDSARYDIYIDNDGDAKADITYTLSSKVEVKTPATFLYNIGAITGLNDPDWNRQQFYTASNNKPVDSVSAFNVHSLVVEVPVARLKQGSEPVLGVWAGTRRATTRVIGALNTISNSTTYVQVSRLGMPLVNELVLPLALKDAFNSIPPSTDLLLYTGVAGNAIRDLLQKSVEDPEIGNLLCALYQVPLPGDANKDCKTEFTLGTPRSGRGDIFDIFLTGMKLAKPFTIQTKGGPVTLPAGFNVNQPATVVPAEMIRINTDIKGDTCSPTPSRLGILGGDACGFPNGRRLTDDIVEIELLAVAGAAYSVLDGRDASFSFNPALINVLNDGIDRNDVPYYKRTKVEDLPNTFPYLGLAQSGQNHWHTNPFFTLLLSWVGKDAGLGQ